MAASPRPRGSSLFQQGSNTATSTTRDQAAVTAPAAYENFQYFRAAVDEGRHLPQVAIPNIADNYRSGGLVGATTGFLSDTFSGLGAIGKDFLGSFNSTLGWVGQAAGNDINRIGGVLFGTPATNPASQGQSPLHPTGTRGAVGTQQQINQQYSTFQAELAALQAQPLDPYLKAELDLRAADLQQASSYLSDRYGLTLSELNRQRSDTLSRYGIDSPFLNASIQREEEAWGLEQQAINMKLGKLAQDVGATQQHLGKVTDNRAAIHAAYKTYETTTDPLFKRAIEAASRIIAGTKPGMDRIYGEEVAGLQNAADQALVRPMSAEYGALDDPAAKALKDRATYGLDLLGNLSDTRYQGGVNVLGAEQRLGVADANFAQVTNLQQVRRRSAVMDAQFSNTETDAMRAVEAAQLAEAQGKIDAQLAGIDRSERKDSLQQRKQVLDWSLGTDLGQLDYRTASEALDYDNALFQLTQDGIRLGLTEAQATEEAYKKLMGMDANTFGAQAAQASLYRTLPSLDPVRRSYLESALTKMFDNGLSNAADAKAHLDEGVANGSFTQAEANALSSALTSYQAGVTRWGQGVTSATTNYGQSFSTAKGTEAPSNQTYAGAARAGTGVYGQRAQYVAQAIPQIASMFNLTSGGQWRDLNAKVTADRSANSDHYSGGAGDFFGSVANMNAGLAWAKNQPGVSFAKVHGSPPHLHISWRLGS